MILVSDAVQTIEITSDETQNIKTFKYKINPEKIDITIYEWHFEMEDGTEVAPPIYGLGLAGNQVAYDTANKLASDFYSDFAGKVEAKAPTSYSYALSKTSKNTYTFYYD